MLAMASFYPESEKGTDTEAETDAETETQTGRQLRLVLESGVLGESARTAETIRRDGRCVCVRALGCLRVCM